MPRMTAAAAARHQAEVVEKIGRDVMGLETLEQRKSDSLDFHDMAVWTMKAALEAAYAAGRASK